MTDLIDADALAERINALLADQVRETLAAITLPDEVTAQAQAMGVAIARAMAQTGLLSKELDARTLAVIDKHDAMSDPAARIVPITPKDDADLPDGPCRAIYVGQEGVVEAVDSAGGAFKLVTGPCQYHPMRVRRVRATGTTARDILALY